MPDGSIVLMGGDWKNDVWRSTDMGQTWTQQTASAEWSPRESHTSVVMPDGSIVLIGGLGSDWGSKSDVWRSTDMGQTWTQQTASAEWIGRFSHTSVVLPDGSIMLVGGWDSGWTRTNDVWRSADMGQTWTQQTANSEWSPRTGHSSIALPDSSIMLLGGTADDGYKNDVWRLMPAGSSTQNPSHTYTAAGTYSVALQAYNNAGYNSSLKTGYIHVTGGGSLNSSPIISNVVVTSTSGLNLTTDYLTASWEASDPEEDPIKNITVWSRNNSPFSVLTLPFEQSDVATAMHTRDYSGHGNNGIVHGATWNAAGGYDGWGAFAFDGTDDYIDLGLDQSLQVQNEITLTAWIKAPPIPDDELWAIVNSQDDWTGSGASIILDGRESPDGQPSPRRHIHFQIGDGSWHTTNSDTVVPENEWVHVVATRRAGEPARIYYNGILQPSTSVPWSGSIQYTSNWSVGQQNNQGRNFKGLIDEVQIFNRALSAEQIVALYQNRTYRIVPQETSFADTWQACVTGNDGFHDSIPSCSNVVTITKVTDFTANVTSGIAPLMVQFTDTSTGYPTSWNWSFGDNTFSDEQNPVHSYNNNGKFTVKLNVTSSNGFDWENKTGYITVYSDLPLLEPELKHVIPINAKTAFVSDLDNDGTNELLVGTYQSGGKDRIILYKFISGSYQPIWNYDIDDTGYGAVTAITTGDTDNDGIKEMVVSTGMCSDSGCGAIDRNLRIFKRSSGELNSWNLDYIYHIGEFTDPLSLAVGDADNDGMNELIVGMSWFSRSILEFKHSGSSYDVSTIEYTGSDVLSINIIDIDHDGLNEIVSGTGCWSEYNVGILKKIGGTWTRTWKSPSYGMSQAASGDLDKDGLNEILATQSGSCGVIGNPGFARIYKNNAEIWNYDSTSAYYIDDGKPAMGDLNGDGVPEFAFITRNTTHQVLNIFSTNNPTFTPEYKYALIFPWAISPDWPTRSYEVIGDSDNNGINEIIMSALYDGTLRIYESSDSPPDTDRYLFSINPDSAGPITNAIIVINGFGFEPGCQVELERNSEVIAIPQQVTYQSSEILSAEFNLSAITAGSSNLTVRWPDNTIRSLPFTVDESLSESVDSPQLIFTTTGDAPWFGQSDEFYYGGSSAQSGLISENQQSVLQTTVNGPANISFYWKVSSEGGYDFLRFFIDGAELASISGESVDWIQVQNIISSGDHTLTWTYNKDSSVSSGRDAGWIDQLKIEPAAFFTANITSGYVPLTVQFYDNSTGSPTSWSWDFGDGATSIEQMPIHTYLTPGTFTVSLNETNSTGSYVAVRTNYIVVNGPAYNSQNGHYYDIITGQHGITWLQANSSAQSLTYKGLQGHLVTITSEEENNFIVAEYGTYFTNLDYFIGGIQPPGSAEPDGGWTWVTGEQWSYTNWYPGEPNNHYGGDDGVHPYGYPNDVLEVWAGGQWNDYVSDASEWDRDGYIVEWDFAAPAPVANFTANVTFGVAPLAVQFTDTSIGTPTSWNWSFGDGFTSTFQNPAHTYSAVGNYTVALNVTYVGSSNTTTRTNYITVIAPPPIVTGITPASGINTTAVSITNLAGSNFESGAGIILTPVNVNPVHKSSIIDAAGSSVFVADNYAYVANSNALEIVDVSDPANPVYKGNITDGAGRCVYVSGNDAYIAGDFGLEIIDVSDPANPVHKGNITEGAGYRVYVSGNYAYVTDIEYDALKIVNISNPADPVLTGSISPLNNARSVSVSGNYAYVVGWTGYLFTVDVSNPAEPVLKNTLFLPEWAESIYVSGNYAYVTISGGDALEILDISDRINPVHKGIIGNGEGGALLDYPQGVYVSGNYAYVASRSSNALEIVDVSDPASPVHKGSITNGAGGAFLYRPQGVYVSGSYAYVVGGSNALEIVDIGTVPATDALVVSPAQITGTLDLTGKTAGAYNVVVTNPDGQSGMLSSGFSVTAAAETPVINGTIITQSATIFIGEQGLDISPALDAANSAGYAVTDFTTIGWWASEADIYSIGPTVSVEATGRQTQFNVTQGEFEGYEGHWYLVDPTASNTAKNGAGAVIEVKAPKLDIAVLDHNNHPVTNSSVVRGTRLKFLVDTNMYPAVNISQRSPLNPATDGYIDLKVKDPNDEVYTSLLNDSVGTPSPGPNSLLANFVDTQNWYWGESGSYSWQTGALDSGTSPNYPLGTYAVWAESTLHGMKDNYLSGGAYYTGRTVAQVYTITLVPAAPDSIVSDFTASITSGTAPLQVSFTDLSSNSPTGWAWFFGDETFTEAWIQTTSSAGWPARSWSSSVVMPDGSIVLMGGSAYGNTNDVWRSSNNGATWTQVTPSAEWTARSGHTSVVMPDGSIVLMGGSDDGGLKNDVWRSIDNGATWTQVTPSAEWTARYRHSSVALPDGSIVVMGGVGLTNDVWRSTDYGATWTQVNASAGWSARWQHTSVAMPDGSIVLMGGFDSGVDDGGYKNDVWRSMDNGATWNMVSAKAEWTARSGHTSVMMPDGSIVLMGGSSGGGEDKIYYNDVYRSTNNGATWTQVKTDAEWTKRANHNSVVLSDSSVLLMGGTSTNDVWRLAPAGSSTQNPSHTYTVPGTLLSSAAGI